MVVGHDILFAMHDNSDLGVCGLAQWWSACLASSRPGVRSPAPPPAKWL